MSRSDNPAGPTLAAVARAARVSVPTVSKVVNGREDVAPETRRRVTEALNRLGYVRRFRSPAAGVRTPQVELVLHRLDSSRSGAVLRGAEAAAAEAGYTLAVSSAPARAAGGGVEERWLRRLVARRPAGVLFHLCGLADSQYRWLDLHDIPFVMVDPLSDPPPHVPTVAATDWRGGLTATQHLLALGHRRIAVIGGSPHLLCGAARMAGHRSALAAAGIAHRAGYEAFGRFDRSQARLRTLELLDLADPPTALFVCSDAMAAGAYQALAERGLRVPADTSVVGFGDLPEAQWLTPALTTVRQPLKAMAATALRLLFTTMAGDPPDAPRTELSTRLILRASTAPPAA